YLALRPCEERTRLRWTGPCFLLAPRVGGTSPRSVTAVLIPWIAAAGSWVTLEASCRDGRPEESEQEGGTAMLALLAMTSGAATLLWIIAAILVIAGIVTLLRGGVLAGIVLIIVGLLIGPGGVSIFK